MAESVSAAETDDVHIDVPVNTLLSFHYFREHDIGQYAEWGLRLIGDSGAFSAASQGAHIDLDEFYEWAARWRSALFWTASLDVIGNEEATLRNWKAAPRHLGLVPTVHYGAEPKALHPYVDEGVDFLGLGGMVPHKSEPKRLLRWALSIMRYAQENFPHLRFHGWGVTHPDLMMNLPWWSVDSSGYSAAFRFANLQLFDPTLGKRVSCRLDGKDAARLANLLRTSYGLDWRRIASSTVHTRRDVTRVAIRGQQLLEQNLQRRWKVTPPASLAPRLREHERGPFLHAVLGFPGSQPPRSLSPTDQDAPKVGPLIHGVMARHRHPLLLKDKA